ncbi:hypothetical protein CF065_07750 [Clostridium sporogenes]
MDILQLINEVNNKSNEKNDKIAPVEILKQFKSGRSKALVFLVEYGEDNKVGIMKFTDCKEAKVFNEAYKVATNNNMQKYIAELICSYNIIYNNKLISANLYDLAGDNIYNIETFLDKVLSEQELKKNVISKIGKFCFTWNKEHKKKYLTPMEIVKKEMSYRYMDKKYKEAFKSIGVSKDIQWVSIDGTEEILPNPYYYFNDENFWGDLKITCLTSYAHGDFQGDNVIITEEKPIIIDFSDLLKDCNVFHDLRCLEAITLGDYLDIYEVKHRQQWLKVCKSVSQDILKVDIPDGKGMSLLRELMPLLRENLKIIVSDMRNVSYNPSFFVAGVAAGLTNMRKFTDIDKKRAAFIYAAYNLKSMLKDKMVNMYNPSLDSCMIFNWVKGNKANKLINLKELIA